MMTRAGEMTKPGRIDVSPDDQSLQLAYIKPVSGQMYRAHKHLPRPREVQITQECWVVIRGIVQVTYYDLDDSEICKRVLNLGDSTITFAGGHSYRSCSETTLVAEVKLGPFVGVEKDKEFID